MIPYEGMNCPTCDYALLLEPDGTKVNIICVSCGLISTLPTVPCRSNNCGSRVFFGGKSGKVPVAIHTGSNHFFDCVDAQRFRKKTAPRAPKAKPEPVVKQAGLL